jgi:hypothetical protein
MPTDAHAGPAGGVPWAALADATVTGEMFVQHVGPRQFVRDRLSGRSRTLLTLLAAPWDRPPADALDWHGRSDCLRRRRRRCGRGVRVCSSGRCRESPPERPADQLGDARLGGPSAGLPAWRARRLVGVARRRVRRRRGPRHLPAKPGRAASFAFPGPTFLQLRWQARLVEA